MTMFERAGLTNRRTTKINTERSGSGLRCVVAVRDSRDARRTTPVVLWAREAERRGQERGRRKRDHNSNPLLESVHQADSVDPRR